MWSRLKNRQLWLASNLLGFLTMFCSNWLMFHYSQQRFLEQHSIVATLLQMVATLFQHCNAVLRWKSLLRMVSCNIILKRPRRGRDNRELKQRRRRRQRERQKSNRFRLVKQQLCTCITLFLHISLPSLQDYNVKVPNFTFCRGRENKTTTCFFFSWTLQSFRACLQGVGDPGLVGLVSFVFTLWRTQNKRNLPH